MNVIFRALTTFLFFSVLAFQPLHASNESIVFVKGIQVKKKYLSENEFLVTDKGIFVLIDGIPRQASRLNSDANGTYVLVAAQAGEWECPICRRPNNTGSICENCHFPLWDNDDP